MRYIFSVHGRDMVFTDEVLSTVLRECFVKNPQPSMSEQLYMKGLSNRKPRLILQINGRRRILTETEIAVLLEYYFLKDLKPPKAGEVFEVSPESINKGFFEEEEKDNWKQENIRRLIQWALKEWDQIQLNYILHNKRNSFKTFIPEEQLYAKEFKTIKELGRHIQEKYNGRIGSLMEKCLEWGQRIRNGESWKAVCEEMYNDSNRQLIISFNNKIAIIGGKDLYFEPSTFPADDEFGDAVPFIVCK